MDPISPQALGAFASAADPTAQEAAKTASRLLEKLLGPSAEVLGADWADRIRRRNLASLLRKTERHAEGKSDPGYAMPRVAAAVFDSAQYADDEIVTDYLSGVLATSRRPDGGDDDALPWTSLISRLSALSLRLHYVLYLNFRQVLRADEKRTRLYEFEESRIMLPLAEVIAASGLDIENDPRCVSRFNDAMHVLKQEELIGGYSYGPPSFFDDQRKVLPWDPVRTLETPFDPVLEVPFTPYGIRLFLWGLGRGEDDEATYLDPSQHLGLAEPDPHVDIRPITQLDFPAAYWVSKPEPEVQT